jgi:hypothetical protein
MARVRIAPLRGRIARIAAAVIASVRAEDADLEATGGWVGRSARPSL